MGKPYRVGALEQACKFVGTVEQPPNSNRGHYIDRWNLDACGVVGVYWCCSFVHGMFKAVGVTLPGGASVLNVYRWALSVGAVVRRPRRGDLVCFDWDNRGVYGDHIGFVERCLAVRWSGDRFTGWVQTVEGNTQSGAAGDQSNGGGVFRRRRWIRGVGATFVRVPGAAK